MAERDEGRSSGGGQGSPGARRLVALAVAPVLAVAVAAMGFLSVTAPSNLVGFGTIDGTDRSYVVYADICGDGDHNGPLYFVWAVEKALAGQ